ncbi:MAG: hypothetical protein AABY22_11245, partial [Nanoarchaeota archaeon]
MTPTTGEIGKTITITGSGIYLIDQVIFSGGYNNIGVSGNFTHGTEFYDTHNTTVSINVRVPEFSAWGKIKLISNSRGVTGYSKFPFVPKPIISGFTPNSGISGTVINVSGFSFSGITGVKVNNLTASFTILSHSGLQFTVPSGNVNGKILLSGQSGVTTLSSENFYPLANLTGLTSYSGQTGINIELLGQNFFTEIMHNLGGTNYLVSFNKATGSFIRINNNKLSGIVPYNSTSGFVAIHKDVNNVYETNTIFIVDQHTPVIFNKANPISGRIGELHFLQGENFKNITGILLSGSSVINDITNLSGTSVSFLNDTIFFINPANGDEGWKNIIVKASGGQQTIFNSGVYTLYPTSITGFTPKFGAIGELITISGRYLYPFSKIYFNSIGGVKLDLLETSSNNIYLKTKLPSEGYSLVSGNTLYIDNTVSIESTGYINFITPLQISGVNRSTGAWLDQVLISGSGVNFVTGVKFSQQNVSFSLSQQNQISFNIQNWAENSKVKLFSSGLGGIGQSELITVLFPKVIISGFSPTGIISQQNLLISGSYLRSTTGIAFSGDGSPLWINATGWLIDENQNLIIAVPNNIITGPVLIGNNSGTTISSTNIEILRSPRITGVTTLSGAYLDTITFSGSFFTGINDFFFNGTTGKLVKGLETSIQNKILATTRVPSGIKQGAIYMSGITGELVFISEFIPLPSISGFNPNNTLTDDDRYPIIITGINCSELASGYLMITGSGRLVNLCDRSLDLRFSHDTTNSLGYTLITGLIQPNFSGSGQIALVSINHTGTFVNTIQNMPSGNIFSASKLIINQVRPTISGFIPYSGGGQGTTFTISGNNLNTITNLYIAFKPTISDSVNQTIT